jgi:cell division protein ZapA
LGALLLADELHDARSRLAALNAEVLRLESEKGRIEARAVGALDAAAARIEKLAAEGA